MKWLAVALCAATTLTAGCALMHHSRADSMSEVISTERGRQLAQGLCGSCHAIGIAGESPAPEAPPFRTLSQSFRVDTLETALTQGISTGHPAMPNMQLPKRDVDDIVAYLQSVQPHRHH